VIPEKYNSLSGRIYLEINSVNAILCDAIDDVINDWVYWKSFNSTHQQVNKWYVLITNTGITIKNDS